MMKILFFFLFMNVLLKNLNKKYLKIFYMNLILLMLMFLLILFPINNLNNLMKIYYLIMMDFYSWGLIILSLWIIFLMVLSTNMKIDYFYLYYFYLLNIMLILLILCFSSMNLILFYIYFESSLIPVFLLIMGWGGQLERVMASFYMMLYTLIGSMPLFLIINYLYMNNYSLMMNILNIKNFSLYMYMSLILAFLIKMPMFMLHLWLPKAHVEAPLIGSMILAGIMLKLGSYGLMRIMFIMEFMCILYNKYIIILSLMGGIISSIICLFQIDLKMLVAYSSVVHMSILLSGLFTMFNWGVMGAFLMMIAHGLCSSGLFCLVNINYERLMSRSLFVNKGMINLYPSLSLMWFLLCSSNFSFPPSLNLFSEVMLFNSLMIWNKMLMFCLMLISFISACYSLYLYSYSQHGKLNNFLFFNIKISEYLLLLLHWIPLNIIFLCLFLFN